MLTWLLALVGCDQQAFGGKELGRIHYDKPGKREQTTLDLPPKTKIAFYENYSQDSSGPGSSYVPEDCFRLQISIEQGTKTKELECYPFGGTTSKWVRSTKCRSSHRSGGKYRKKLCRINDCTAVLNAGGESTISAELETLKPCYRRVTAHTLIIKEVDD